MTSADQSSLGVLIKRERVRQGLSQAALAARFHCSVDSIQHWEKGKSTPHPQWREAISQFLQLPYETLFPDQRRPPSSIPPESLVRSFALNDPLFKQGKMPVADYFLRPLFQAVCETLRAAITSGSGGVIISGPAMVGKTRMALQALRQEAADFVLLVSSRETPPPDDLFIYRDQDVAWLLDDLHELSHERDVQQITQTLRQLQKIARRLIVVATTRSGSEGDLVLRNYRGFIQALGLVRMRLQSMEKGRDEWQRFLAFADTLVAQGKTLPFDPATFDGTPGSILLGLDLRTEALRYADFPANARAILMALALLRKAGFYHFPERRVRRVAEHVFEVPPERWAAALDYLVQTAWLSLDKTGEPGESRLVLFTNAYLDVCLAQSGFYPRGGLRIEDDFPRLAKALSREPPDAAALFQLSYALFADRRALAMVGIQDDKDFRPSYALFADRGRGTWAEWSELSWECANLGLASLDPQRDPELWAEGQYALGIACWRRWQGAEEGNRQQAIQAFQAALRVFTPQRGRGYWVAIQKALGNVYLDLLQGGRANNVERSIAYYEAGLQVATREEAPLDWARLQHNLGIAYARRTRGDHAQNLARSVAYIEAALTIFTREEHPYFWAFALNNLAVTHLTGRYGKTSEHQEEAIRCLRASLEIRTREEYAYDWASTQERLGAAYRLRLAGDRAANIEQAIAHLTAALEVLRGKQYERDRARVQCQLGQAYLARINGARANNLAKAQAAFDEALAVQARHLSPLPWAETTAAKALLHEALSDEAAQRGNLLTAHLECEQAVALLSETLAIYTAEDFPDEFASVQAALNRLRTPVGRSNHAHRSHAGG